MTRSFSDRVEDLATMEQAVAAHATRLGEKLRAGGLATDHVTVFFHTSEHDRDRPQRSVSTVVTLSEASNDTMVPMKAATFGVRKVWRDGFRYSKAGIVTTDLVPLTASQRAFPGLGQLDREHGAALMQALDACNRRFGRGAVVPGTAGFAPQARVVNQVRNALAPLHHADRRGADGGGGLVAAAFFKTAVDPVQENLRVEVAGAITAPPRRFQPMIAAAPLPSH